MVLEQPRHEFGARIDFFFFFARSRGQQHAGLDQRQGGGHHQILPGDIEIEGLHEFEIGEILGTDFSDGNIRDLDIVLSDEVKEKIQEQSLVVDLGSGAGAQQEVRSFPRFSTRDRQVSMAVTGSNLVIEARTYEGFDRYVDLLRAPLDAVARVVQPDGVTSIGHRFIDEVDLPSGDLGRWFDPALVAMPSLLDDAAEGWQAVVSYRLSGEAQMTLRYGLLDASLVPSPNGKVRTFSSPVMGLDWDSHWQPQSIPEFDAEAILDRLARMYAPVRKLFREVCTDDLRRTFEAESTERTE